MNRLLLAGLALILLGGGLILYSHLRARSAVPAQGAAAALAEAPITQGRYQETGAGYRIDAGYPTTTPLAGSANDAALDAIQGWVIDTVGAFKTRIASGTNASLIITYEASSSPVSVSYLFLALATEHGATSTTTHAFSFSIADATP